MINMVVLVGRLGSDPETRYLASGTAVTKVSLATNRSWKDKTSDEWKEETAWHKVTVWGAMAERVSQNMVKGDLAYVQGRIKYDKYTGPDGVEKYFTEIVADQFRKVAGGKGGEEAAAARVARGGGRSPEPFEAGPPFEDDDIPF